MPKSAKSQPAKTGASPTDIGVLGLIPELRDAAHDDGVNAQEFADFRRGVRIRAIAIREILLG